MQNKTIIDRIKIEQDITAYLLKIGYPASKVRSMMTRHKFKGKRGARLLAKNLKKTNVVILNLGCGSGMNHYHLVNEFPSENVYGLDVDERAIELCREYNPESSNNINKYDGVNIPFTNNFFDGIICETVIEHVKNPDLFLREIYRVLKYDGILYITTANKLWPFEPHYNLFALSWLPKKWANRYIKMSGLKRSYYDVNLLTYGKFVKQLRHAGFKIYDATFDVMEYPELYDADKERPILKYFKSIGKIINLLPYSMKYILQYLNFGWIIIAKKDMGMKPR